MEPLIWHERPELRNPTLVAAFGGWSDAQEAATGAVRFIAEQLKATKFAEIESEDFYSFFRMRPFINVDENGTRTIRWPANDFFYWRNDKTGADFIFFAGLEPQLHWKTYSHTLVQVVEACKASPVFVVGAMLDGTPHTRMPGVTGSASTPQLREVLAEAGVSGVRRRSRYQGPTGISSVFTIECQEKGIEYANVWGHAPHYLQSSPNPKVTLSVAQSLLKFLPLPVDLSPLRAATQEFEQEVAKATAGNLELQGYIRRLEQQFDEGIQSQAMAQPNPPPEGQETPRGELPSSDVLLRDVEEFFRRRPGDQPGSPQPEGPQPQGPQPPPG